MASSAQVTIKLDPSDYRFLRERMERAAEDDHEHAREIRGQDPKLANQLTTASSRMQHLLEVI